MKQKKYRGRARCPHLLPPPLLLRALPAAAPLLSKPLQARRLVPALFPLVHADPSSAASSRRARRRGAFIATSPRAAAAAFPAGAAPPGHTAPPPSPRLRPDRAAALLRPAIGALTGGQSWPASLSPEPSLLRPRASSWGAPPPPPVAASGGRLRRPRAGKAGHMPSSHRSVTSHPHRGHHCSGAPSVAPSPSAPPCWGSLMDSEDEDEGNGEENAGAYHLKSSSDACLPRGMRPGHGRDDALSSCCWECFPAKIYFKRKFVLTVTGPAWTVCPLAR